MNAKSIPSNGSGSSDEPYDTWPRERSSENRTQTAYVLTINASPVASAFQSRGRPDQRTISLGQCMPSALWSATAIHRTGDRRAGLVSQLTFQHRPQRNRSPLGRGCSPKIQPDRPVILDHQLAGFAAREGAASSVPAKYKGPGRQRPGRHAKRQSRCPTWRRRRADLQEKPKSARPFGLWTAPAMGAHWRHLFRSFSFPR